MGSDYEDTLYAVLGFGGGFLPAFAHVPQIYRVHVRKSCRDISYAYQFTFAIGMALFICYYGYKRRYPLLIPAILSFVMILYLIAFKTYLEVLEPRLQGSRHDNDSDLREALLQETWDGLGGEENREGTGSRSSDDEFLGYARSSRPDDRRASSRI